MQLIGTLFYESYLHMDLTQIYIDDDNNPIIKDWYDWDDKEGDLYLMFKVSADVLKAYMNKSISTIKFIESAIDSKYYTYLDNAEKYIETNLNDIRESLPDNDVFFDQSDCFDFDIIKNKFNF